MYGFKPRHAQGKPVQNLADGGIVHSLTGMLGMRKRTPEELRAADAKSQARNQEAATAAAGRAQAAPAPATPAAPAKAISDYSGMLAMQRREKEQGLADGGAVKPRGFVVGKGTGTSDSIPARLSNGEYVLPADTVKAVGVEALDSLRAATHTPVKHEQAKAAHGFFAGGTPGGVDEEKRKSSFGDAAAVARSPGVTQTPTGMPAPAQSGAGFMPGTRSVYNESGKAISDLASQGRYGAAAGETARAALSYVPAVADDVIGGALRAVGPGVMDAGRQFFGGSQPGTAAPPTPPASPAAPVDQNPTDQRMAAAPTVPQQAPVTAPVQRMAQPPQSPAFDFDNYQPAPGQGAFRNEQTGEVTRLQDGPSPTRDTRIWKEPNVLPRSDARPASPRQDVRAPVLNPNGGVFAAMADFTNQTGDAVNAIAANKGARNDRKDDLDQTRVDADIAATGARLSLDGQRVGLDAQRVAQGGESNRIAGEELSMRREAAGFQTRAAKRMEDLQNSYQSAKTPEERAAIAQQLRELQVKDAPARMQTVTLPDTTNEMGQVMRGGQALVRELRDGTVEQVQIGAAQAPQALPPKDQLKAGKTYPTPRGPARWDGNQFTPV